MPPSILGLGTDIVEIARIERMRREHADRFLSRVFTPAEIQYCCDSTIAPTRLAGRFAAKEAVLKVLGTGWRGGIEWTDIEVLPDALGKPICRLHGYTASLAASLDVSHVLVSISHAGGFAIATAIGISAFPDQAAERRLK